MPAPHFRTQLHAVMLGGFASMASARLCDAMLPQLALEFGGTVSSAAKVVAWFALGYGLAQLVYGPLGDRLGKLRIIFFACCLSTIAALACALAPNLESLSIARFVAGAFGSGVVPLALAWIGDSIPYDERQPQTAKLMVGTISGLIVGQVFGALASDTVGWRFAFVLLALLYAGCAWRLRVHAIQARAEPNSLHLASPGATFSQNAAKGVFASYWAVLKTPSASIVLPVVLCEGFLVFGMMAFLPSFLHERDQVSISLASLCVAGVGLGGLLYAWQSKAWLARLGESGFARFGASLFCLGMCCVALLPGLGFAFVACFAAGLGFYMLHNTLQTMGSQMAPQSRGSGMALFALALFLGQTLGVSHSAWFIAARGYVELFVISSLLTLALGWWLGWRIKRQQA